MNVLLYKKVKTMRTFVFLLFLIQTFGLFWKIPFGPKFSIKNKEIHKTIRNDAFSKNKHLNKIKGFYGLIGPDIDTNNIKSLFDLFIGDGMVQGIFLNEGNITFIKQYIRTDKLLYESENGRVPNLPIIQLFFMVFSRFHVLPDLMGLANTHLLKVKNSVYAVYERDKPYLLDINYENNTLNTIGKMKVNSLQHFSGHSKYNGSVIETIDYRIFDKIVSYQMMNENFELIKTINMRTEHLPVIHDFYATNDSVFIIDSPIVLNPSNLLKNELPVKFDKTKVTWIHVLNKTDLTKTKYYINSAFYLFHYGSFKETDGRIELCACLYDDLDFATLNIKGNYRKIIIDKYSREVFIEKNAFLETYNLDFPVVYKDNVILRNIENNIVNGFVICKDLNIEKRIVMKNRFICGEPSIVKSKNTDFLMGFSNDLVKLIGCVFFINMNTYEIIEIPVSNHTLPIGFHANFFT